MHHLSRTRRAMHWPPRGGIFLLYGAAAAGCDLGRHSVAPLSRTEAPPSAVASQDARDGGVAAPRNEVTRKLLASADVPGAPGFESRIYFIEYPPGVQAPPHTHTAQDIGYVIDGRFEAEFGDDPIFAVGTGEGFVEAAGHPHRFRNADRERPLRFVIAGTYRKDQPIFVPVAEPVAFLSKELAPAPPSVGETPGDASGPAPSPREPQRTLLEQRDVPELPGMELRLYLMKFPPSAESKLHLHESPGIGYVVEGSFESAFGDDPVTVKHAGDGFVDMPGRPHHFRNADSARPLQFVFAGTFHKNEPLLKVVAP